MSPQNMRGRSRVASPIRRVRSQGQSALGMRNVEANNLLSSGLVVDAVNYGVRAPDSVALSITGDVDIRVKLTLADWTPTGERQFVTKMLDTSQGYMLRMLGGSSGDLGFSWTDSGGSNHTATATTDTGITDGATYWVRGTLDVDNGAGGRDIAFYKSADGSSWTQIGSTVTQAGTTSVKNTTDACYLGGVGPTTDDLLHYVEIRNGIAGTVVADPDFTGHALTETSFADGQGNTWTLSADASFV